MYEKEEKYMKKVAFATGSRADYGIMREYLRLLNNDENIDLSILVTGALLDDIYYYLLVKLSSHLQRFLIKISMIC